MYLAGCQKRHRSTPFLASRYPGFPPRPPFFLPRTCGALTCFFPQRRPASRTAPVSARIAKKSLFQGTRAVGLGVSSFSTNRLSGLFSVGTLFAWYSVLSPQILAASSKLHRFVAGQRAGAVTGSHDECFSHILDNDEAQ